MISFFFFRLYLFIFRQRGSGGRKKERNYIVWLTLMRPLLGAWPATQACALSGNRTGDLLVRRPVLNPLSHSSQGWGRVIPLRKRVMVIGSPLGLVIVRGHQYSEPRQTGAKVNQGQCRALRGLHPSGWRGACACVPCLVCDGCFPSRIQSGRSLLCFSP